MNGEGGGIKSLQVCLVCVKLNTGTDSKHSTFFREKKKKINFCLCQNAKLNFNFICPASPWATWKQPPTLLPLLSTVSLALLKHRTRLREIFSSKAWLWSDIWLTIIAQTVHLSSAFVSFGKVNCRFVCRKTICWISCWEPGEKYNLEKENLL